MKNAQIYYLQQAHILLVEQIDRLTRLNKALLQRYWKVHFAKKTRGAWHNVKYLGRYLKRPPISASQLKHYSGGTVVHHIMTTTVNNTDNKPYPKKK